MQTRDFPIEGLAPGNAATVRSLHFGSAGERPRVYIQAGLHADETPAHLCAQHLRRRLAALEAAGRLHGEVVLVPVANPLGLGQQLLGDQIGRFALGDGGNFNRAFPDLTEAAASRLEPALTGDSDRNVAAARTALAEALAALKPCTPAERLKHWLLSLAGGADFVLDLHCDAEATNHLYTLTPQAETFQDLADRLECRAFLLAEDSGDMPFDEAVSRPWLNLARLFPGRPLPMAAFAATVELRGQRDVSDEFAAADAEAIITFLTGAGVIKGNAPPRPPVSCLPTDFAACDVLVAPHAGIVVHRRRLGETVSRGDVMVDVVDPLSGEATSVVAGTDGVFFARAGHRFAQAGGRLGKIAGHVPLRTGKLLSP